MTQVEQALAFLSGLPPDSRLAVGFSGGMDSAVLLRAAREALPAGANLRALHVNHRLRQAAQEWERFCGDFCAALEIPLEILRVDVPASGASLENRARIARYEAFSRNLQPGERLLLAHHLDDQLETLLLRLSRGAGPRGLSGIPAQRELGRGLLLRPLLQCPRTALADYARARDLRWIEDASNRNIDFDRNFCRHEVLPAVERRWPGYRRAWERSRALIAESRDLLAELAEIDLARCAGAAERQLRVDALRRLRAPRRRNALRHWIEQHCAASADRGKLLRLSDSLLAADHPARAAVDFGGHFVRCFDNELYLVPELPPVDPDTRLAWDPSREPVLELPGNGILRAAPRAGAGLAGKRYEIRYRRGGESCRLARRPTKSLKKILNESRVEPWLRARLPLLFDGGELVAIPGVGHAESAAAAPGYDIEWRSLVRREPAA